MKIKRPMMINAIGRLMRLENSAMAGIAVLVGFIVAGGSGGLAGGNFENAAPLILAAASAFLITGAGNAINDYFDREIDRRNAPHRPIPAGMISPEDALAVSVALFIFGVVLAFFVNIGCLLLAALNSLILYAYAKHLKGSILFGNLGVSYLTGSTFVYGGLAAGNALVTFFLFLLAFFANLGREIIGDVEDILGDKKAGIRTMAMTLGPHKSWLAGSAMIILAALLSPLPYLMGLLGLSYLIVVLAADALFVASVARKDARRNQKLTKIGILVGLIAFLVGALV